MFTIGIDYGTNSAQLVDMKSSIHFTHTLIVLRKKHPALGNAAAFRPLCAEPGRYPFVYERSGTIGRLAISPGEFARSVDLPALKGAKLTGSSCLSPASPSPF